MNSKCLPSLYMLIKWRTFQCLMHSGSCIWVLSNILLWHAIFRSYCYITIDVCDPFASKLICDSIPLLLDCASWEQRQTCFGSFPEAPLEIFDISLIEKSMNGYSHCMNLMHDGTWDENHLIGFEFICVKIIPNIFLGLQMTPGELK